MISHQLGQIAATGAMQFRLRIISRVYNGFSIRLWPILLCKGRLLPLIGKDFGRNLRRGSIHGDNSRSERLPCLLKSVSLSDVIPKLFSQNFDRAFEHILVQYGGLITRGGPKFWKILEFCHVENTEQKLICGVLLQRIYFIALFWRLLAYMYPHSSVRRSRFGRKIREIGLYRTVSQQLGKDSFLK